MSDDRERGREISITAKIDETGFTASVRSRLAATLEDLLGAGFEWPTEWIKGKVQHQSQKNETQKVLAALERDAAAKILQEIPELGQRAVRKFLGTEIRKQQNLEAITFQAVDELKQLPPPIAEEVDDESEELDPDWMNVFEDYAAKASSERLRTLWARILAGEIRKPTSFSRTTMRLVAEMDQSIALVFESALEMLLDGSEIPQFEHLSGKKLQDFLFLEEVGLLQDVSGMIARPHNASDDSVIANGGLLLRFHVLNAFHLEFIPLTRAGREIAKIIPKAADDIVLRRIAENFRESITEVKLAKIVKREGFGFHARNIEELT